MPATFLFIIWVPFAIIPFLGPIFIHQRWIPVVVSSLFTIGVGWYIWRKLGSVKPGLITHILLGGIILGGFSLCIGFFGPIIFYPGSGLGPLLGLLITGPLGFLFGLLGGYLYWLNKSKRITKTSLNV